MVKEKSSKGGVFTSESKFSEEVMDIRKDFVTIHGEMVLLKNYSSLNFAGTFFLSAPVFNLNMGMVSAYCALLFQVYYLVRFK